MGKLFFGLAAKFADFPYLGRVGQIRGTLELIIHENFRLVYEADGQVVWILALVSTVRFAQPNRTLFGVPTQEIVAPISTKLLATHNTHSTILHLLLIPVHKFRTSGLLPCAGLFHGFAACAGS